MKKSRFIYLVIIALIGIACKQVEHNKQAENVVAELNIKNCKIYSSDFVLLNPDEKGSLIQEFRFNRKGFVNELIRYDLEGNVIGKFDIYGENTPFPMPGKPEFVDTVLTVVDIDSIGTIKNTEIKFYNNSGLLTQVEFYEGESKLIKKNTYRYDESGMIYEDIYWDVDLDKPKQKIQYEFEYFND